MDVEKNVLRVKCLRFLFFLLMYGWYIYGIEYYTLFNTNTKSRQEVNLYTKDSLIIIK